MTIALGIVFNKNIENTIMPFAITLKTIPIIAITPLLVVWFGPGEYSKIATAAFGYADGYRRSSSNKGVVLVNGKRVPVIGRVTMDMTMLDVTECPKVHVGDEVVLIGEQGKETISVEEMAELCQTSAYEIFCNIAARVARVDLV